jgi:hypothetical protein
VPTAFTSYAFPASGGPISGVSPVPRTMPDRYNDVINVKDFGAKGDGVTDDTAAIINANIYAFSLHREPLEGAILFFPPGTYRINNPPLFLGPVLSLVSTTGGTAGVTDTVTFSFVPSGLKVGMKVVQVNPFPFPNGTKISSISRNTIQFDHKALSNFGIGTGVNMEVTPDGIEQGNVRIVGAGRDASIIRGNYSGGSVTDAFYLVMIIFSAGGTHCDGLNNLTVWNESTAAGSGAYIDQTNINNWIGYYNCNFIGVVGCHLGWQSFGVSIHSCNMYCSNLISTASPTGPPPPPVFPTIGQGNLVSGSVGLYFAEGEIENCLVAGFDYGFALSQNVITMHGCRASRCNVGVDLGRQLSRGSLTTFPSPVTLFGNLFDRCYAGINEFGGCGPRFANVICGNLLNDVKTGLPSGPNSDCVGESAAISQIIVSGGTAAVTTAHPHTLGNSGTIQIELILSPTTLTPDGSGNQVVTVTLTGPNTFTYGGLGVSGTFSNPGGWNFPSFGGITGSTFNNNSYFSNLLTLRCTKGSFVLIDPRFGQSGTGGTRNNFVCATQGPYGWQSSNTGQDPNHFMGSQFTYVMCGMPASSSLSLTPSVNFPNPIAYLTFAALTSSDSDVFEGKEINIVDGQKKGSGKAAFRDIVSGSGSDHYKVRYDGKNWRRVG